MRVYPITMPMPTVRHGKHEYPLMAGVIETPHDLIMVDTGFVNNDAVFEKLKEIGFTAEDLNIVINTHVHPDHVGNNRSFTNARIIASRVDYEFAKGFSTAILTEPNTVSVFKKYYPEVSDRLIERSALAAKRLAANFWNEHTIGDVTKIQWIEDNPNLPEGIELLHTPGHVPGHYSVIVNGKNRSLIFSGDAMASRIFWKRKLREIAPRQNEAETMASRQKIEAFDGIILGGHDQPFYSHNAHYVDYDTYIQL